MNTRKVLTNGIAYDLAELDGIEIIDDNIVRNIGMNKLASKQPTHFQLLLNQIIKDKYEIPSESFPKLAEKLLAFKLPNNKHPLQMFSERNSDIIDAYNDSSRRFFESVFAKKMLTSLLDGYSIALVHLYIQSMSEFLINQYQLSAPSILNDWKKAKAGDPVKNETLQHFSQLRKDFKKLGEEYHFKGEVSLTQYVLEDLYDFHYLTHNIPKISLYQHQFPLGIFEIYNDSNPFFGQYNRGRIHGFGFNFENPSLHLGIFRSIDKVPRDLTASGLLSKTTRCPDRLYMIHPEIARKNPDNWLNAAFANPLNSCYVNGLSGSMLVELRNLQFYLHNHPQSMALENHFEIIKHFLLLTIGLFVYFEGGHTLTEVLAVMEIDEVKSSINGVLGVNPMDKPALSRQSLIFDNIKVMSLLKESLIEAAKYYANLMMKDGITDELNQTIINKSFTAP